MIVTKNCLEIPSALQEQELALSVTHQVLWGATSLPSPAIPHHGVTQFCEREVNWSRWEFSSFNFMDFLTASQMCSNLYTYSCELWGVLAPCLPTSENKHMEMHTFWSHFTPEILLLAITQSVGGLVKVQQSGLQRKKKNPTQTLICSICQLPWSKYAYHGWLQAAYMK